MSSTAKSKVLDSCGICRSRVVGKTGAWFVRIGVTLRLYDSRICLFLGHDLLNSLAYGGMIPEATLDLYLFCSKFDFL